MKITLLTFLFLVLGNTTFPQKKRTITFLLADSKQASLFSNGQLETDQWNIDPNLKPDIWEVKCNENSTTNCTFVTDKDTFNFTISPQEEVWFGILFPTGDTALTLAKGIPPACFFSLHHQSLNNHKKWVETPEVFELVNILIALTPKGTEQEGLINQNTEYYKNVIRYFAPFKLDNAVLKFQEAMEQKWWLFIYFRMDAFAFEFKKGKIVKKESFNRISWDNHNSLDGFIPVLESFAKKSSFRKFYRDNRRYYQNNASFVRDSLNGNKMIDWLSENYPETSYNCYRTIFSTLIGDSQSAVSFQSNNFSESHIYINFPEQWNLSFSLSKEGDYFTRQIIYFTELNHTFINPHLKKYAESEEFKIAFQDLGIWEDSTAQKGYPNGFSCFAEYMNWGIVGVWMDQSINTKDGQQLTPVLEKIMANRGFLKFDSFMSFLRNLCKGHPEKKLHEHTKDIIFWFKQNSIQKK